MKRLDRQLRRLDPLARLEHQPDGEWLLERILRKPPPPSRREPSRFFLPGVVATAATAAVVGAMFAVLPLGGTSDEREVSASSGVAEQTPDGSVLHYSMRVRTRGRLAESIEVWQADDGSRERVIRRATGMSGGYQEMVITRGASQVFLSTDNPPQVIEYNRAIWKPSAPAGYGLPPAVGDPRTLPERADRGAAGIETLGRATVNGKRALRFRVGTCQSSGMATTVTVAVDTQLPLRAKINTCGGYDAQFSTPLDYAGFKVLPPSPETQSLLSMSEHPGVPVVSGEEIDRQEEAMDEPAAPTPTPRAER